MENMAISVENISKRYVIGDKLPKYELLIENAPRIFTGLFRARKKKQAIWALQDVTFEVKRGEVIGIIGRNGAGKSTLLKIISRIVEPTGGRVTICGKVGAILEIGAGFHEELSGRENIYLNGAILGMGKKEIRNKFDEIVEFSGVEKFLDTPIKYYSSGMHLRLAFSIAANLDSEILLVDELLAVGDVEFQNKCFGKIRQVTEHGRTVLFVSHNMTAINAFCSSALLLESGRIAALGNKEEVISKYLETVYKLVNTELQQRNDRQGDGRMRFTRYWLENAKGQRTTAFRSGESAVICVQYSSNNEDKLRNVSVAFALKDYMFNQITDLANRVSANIWDELPSSGVIRCKMARLPLVPGRYMFNVFSRVNGIIADWIIDAGIFEVEAGSFFQNGKLPDPGQGNILIDQSWEVS
ncbi:MAG: ABC transporter ATP-binding protein [Candidatus Omnitrophica bacterium]|nr:ABC transporter ATP-binding protein [Candidatus Omnitrophota bacterium]